MCTFVTFNTQSLQHLLETCHNCTKGNAAKVFLSNELEKTGMESVHPFLFECCDTIVLTGGVTWHSEPVTLDIVANRTQTSHHHHHHHQEEEQEYSQGTREATTLKDSIEFVDTSAISEETECTVKCATVSDGEEVACDSEVEKDPLFLEGFTALNVGIISRDSDNGGSPCDINYCNVNKEMDGPEDSKRSALRILSHQDVFGCSVLSDKERKSCGGSNKRKKYPDAFTCEYCGKVYTGKDRAYEFYHHRNSEHTRAMSFKCTECPKEFWGDRELLAHRTAQHLSEGNVCDTCGRHFRHRKNLVVHLLTHDSRREHVCGYCDKAFKRKDHLVTHERIHNGIRPYQCKWCDSGYPQNIQLKLHMLNCPALPKKT